MKIEYKGKIFDSEQEKMYYDHLSDQVLNGQIEWFNYLNEHRFKKHPIQINLGRRKNYMPDFLFSYLVKKPNEMTKLVFQIVELKGYAKWSANEDNNIMDWMKNKVATDQDFLKDWIESLGYYVPKDDCFVVEYRRLKYNKTYGFVDYDWKNPNSVSNQRKIKVETLTKELKEANEKIKKYERYFSYLHKDKLTKSQREWKEKFESEINYE